VSDVIATFGRAVSTDIRHCRDLVQLPVAARQRRIRDPQHRNPNPWTVRPGSQAHLERHVHATRGRTSLALKNSLKAPREMVPPWLSITHERTVPEREMPLKNFRGQRKVCFRGSALRPERRDCPRGVKHQSVEWPAAGRNVNCEPQVVV